MRIEKLPFHFLSIIGFYHAHKIDFRLKKQSDDPTYYIIRRANCWGEAGFFSNYFYVLAHFAFALKQGLRPVIDMRNYKTLYSEHRGVNGEQNAWNYYFRQPYKTRDAYKSRHFILSDCSPPQGFNPIRETDSICELNPNNTPELSEIAQNDLSIRPDLLAQFKTEFNRLFAGKRVLGVHYRGGDKHEPPPGHRSAISEGTLVCFFREMLAKKPDAVFLASDEDGIAELLEAQTDIPIVRLSAKRLPTGSREGLHMSATANDRPMARYLLGLEVLRDAWFLSQCDYLLCGHSNVSNAAMFLRGRPFRDIRVVDTGAPARINGA